MATKEKQTIEQRERLEFMKLPEKKKEQYKEEIESIDQNEVLEELKEINKQAK
jgi:hypothetical protein